MRFHKIDRAKDRNFWSVRVSRDLRLIVHKTGANLLLCYVDHHDAAYRWAEGRRLETHPRTGAAQIVEIRETVREIEVPRYSEIATTGGEIGRRHSSSLRGRLRRRFAWLRSSRLLARRCQGCDRGLPSRTIRTPAGGGGRSPVGVGDGRLADAPGAAGSCRSDGGKSARVLESGRPILSRTRTRNVASGRWRTRKSCVRPSIIPGRSGLSSSIRLSAGWWSATTAARPVLPAPQAPERPSWRCIGRSTLPARIQMPESCWRPSPKPWRRNCESGSPV